MNAIDPATSPDGASWLKPSVEATGLARYISTIRERKWLILATVLVTTLAALAYVLTAPKVYKAETDLLVTPIASDDTTYAGLGLIQASSDPTRDVETASKLVTTVDVARRVKIQLHDGRTPTQLLQKISVAPVATSNIVAVTAQAPTPGKAKRLADAFATQAVALRTSQFHTAIDAKIGSLQAQMGRNPGNTALVDPNSLPAQLARLQTARTGPDPTVRVQTLAEAPNSPSSPKTKLSLAAGILAGLVLGVGGAFALQVLDPRLRREEQLRRLYSLPILARIPKDSRAHGAGALAPEMLSPSTIEAYRTLRATLAASRGRDVGATSIL